MDLRFRRGSGIAVFVLVFGLGACGDSADKACVPGSSEGCSPGLVCESLGTVPGCVEPVIVAGSVVDSTTDAGIAGARVVAMDANGAVRSAAAVTGADGSYRLQVPTARDADGVPLAGTKVTLRADANRYLTFPWPPREAVPVDLGDGVENATAHAWEVVNAATEVRLVPLLAGGQYTVSGAVEGGSGGILVVADQGGAAVSTGLTDPDGTFVLFNVPEGDTTVSAYAAGLGSEPVQVTVDGDETGVKLVASAADLAVVSGSVNLVNAPGGSVTSVILVVESTFQPDAARGIAPAGLRAGDVTGAFAIADVPPGKYVALAAFENDGLVRDPDTGIGGTEIVHLEVVRGQAAVALEQSFKVTGALAVKSPDAEGIGLVSGAQPSFGWADDSSEDGYEFEIFDAYGNRVYQDLDVPGVSGSDTVTTVWANAKPMSGMIYQFRARSFREDKKTAERRYISATEDLRGVFLWQP